MGQILRTDCRVGKLFELSSHRIPRQYMSAATTTPSPSYQWHLYLGHTYAGKLQPLASHGLLGNAKFIIFFVYTISLKNNGLTYIHLAA